MDFGSKFVYWCPKPEEGIIPEDDFRQPLQLGRILDEVCKDDDSEAVTRSTPAAIQISSKKDSSKKKLTQTLSSIGLQEEYLAEATGGTLTLNVKNIVNTLANVKFSSAHWKLLGVQLIEKGKVDVIQLNQHDADHRLSELSHQWISSDTKASWIKLAEAVSKLPMYGDTTAKKILKEAKYIISEDKASGIQGGIHVRFPTPNVLEVKLNCVNDITTVHSGEPVICSNKVCEAILSRTSTINDKQIWVCEYCGNKNEVALQEGEKPKEENTTYIVSPRLQSDQCIPTVKSNEESILLFCVDISGSMCSTTQVSSEFQLKENTEEEKLIASEKVNRASQFLPGESSNCAYISRLQFVQDAISKQLDALSDTSPSLRVGIITFSDEVLYIGDGSKNPVVIAGDRLSDIDELRLKAEALRIPNILRNTKSQLEKKIMKLRSEGQTALGPALAVAIDVAGTYPGSKVILCTDGAANIGLGLLDGIIKYNNPEQNSADKTKMAEAETFYKDLGLRAVEKGVTVSLITFNFTSCCVSELYHIVNITEGVISQVQPSDISHEFSCILANQNIATRANCKLVLQKDLFFETEETESPVIKFPLGNIKADTEFSFEFRVCESTSTLKDPENIPFQLVIDFVRPDRQHVMKVFTKVMPVTSSKEEAEKGLNMSVIGNHAIRTAASLAAVGKFTEARATTILTEKLLRKASTLQKKIYITVMGELVPLENKLLKAQSEMGTVTLQVPRPKKIVDSSLPCMPSQGSHTEMRTELGVMRRQKQKFGDHFHMKSSWLVQRNRYPRYREQGIDAKPKLPELIKLKGKKTNIKLIEMISHRWEDLASQLGFEREMITEIADEYPSPRDAAQDVLSRWLYNEGKQPVTWKTIITALREARFDVLAKDVEEALKDQ